MGETSFWNIVWVRNVFLEYCLGAKLLSEICLGCETSFKTMNTWAKRLSYLWGGGESSFLSMSWGRNVSLKNGANWLWGEKSVHLHEWLKLGKLLNQIWFCPVYPYNSYAKYNICVGDLWNYFHYNIRPNFAIVGFAWDIVKIHPLIPSATK